MCQQYVSELARSSPPLWSSDDQADEYITNSWARSSGYSLPSTSETSGTDENDNLAPAADIYKPLSSPAVNRKTSEEIQRAKDDTAAAIQRHEAELQKQKQTLLAKLERNRPEFVKSTLDSDQSLTKERAATDTRATRVTRSMVNYSPQDPDPARSDSTDGMSSSPQTSPVAFERQQRSKRSTKGSKPSNTTSGASDDMNTDLKVMLAPTTDDEKAPGYH